METNAGALPGPGEEKLTLNVKPTKKRDKRVKPEPEPEPGPIPEFEIGELSNSASMFLTVLDGMVTAMLGPAAALAPAERALIEPALKRIMERSGLANSEAFQKFLDPVTLIIGLVAWGSRVARVYNEKNAAAKQELSHDEKRPAQEPEPEPGEYNPADVYRLMAAAPVNLSAV